MKKIWVGFLALASIGAGNAQAAHFFNASLIPDIAIYKKTEKISGFALSIWGENEIHGLALGFVNGMNGDSGGVAFGLVNYANKLTGAQIGAVNYGNNILGGQLGFINFVKGTITGAQFGPINYAEKLNGLQFGIVNYAQTAETGVQIGLVNIMPINKTFFTNFPHAVAPVMILANWRFN